MQGGVVDDVDVAVGGNCDVRILHVVRARRQQRAMREGRAVVERPVEVDVGAAVADEPGVGEVDIVTAGALRPVCLDRRLVLELAEQVRGRAPARHDHAPGELLAVVDRRPSRALRVDERGNPHVAERLLRAGRVIGRLRSSEQPPLSVPGKHRVACRGGAHMRASGIRRRVVRVTGHERTGERRATVLRPVVAEPDRTGGDRGAELVDTVVEDAAVVVRAAHDDLGVARVHRHRRLVLTPSRAGALGERRVGIGGAGRECVVTHITGRRWSIVTEPYVGAGSRRGCTQTQQQRGNPGGHQHRREPATRLDPHELPPLRVDLWRCAGPDPSHSRSSSVASPVGPVSKPVIAASGFGLGREQIEEWSDSVLGLGGMPHCGFRLIR